MAIRRVFQYLPKTIEIDIKIIFNDKELAIKHLISELDIEDIMPPKYPMRLMHPADAYEVNLALGKRKRFIDMISSKIAWEFTKALTGKNNLMGNKV